MLETTIQSYDGNDNGYHFFGIDSENQGDFKMAKNRKTIKDVSDEVQLLSDRILKLERMVCVSNLNDLKEKVIYLEDLIKVYDSKIVDLDNKLIRFSLASPSSFNRTCKICGISVEGKNNWIQHKRDNHGKTFKCKFCDEAFCESWKLESHMKLHESAKTFNCTICNKVFYMKWRLDKHVTSHDQNQKFCHFFNNNKVCPFENIGCMFRHEESSECRFQTSCNLKRCQFKHPYITDRVATKDRNECETSDEEELDNHDEDDEATDYETIDYVQVNENDLRDLEFKECGACSTVLTIENSYKCKTCGEP